MYAILSLDLDDVSSIQRRKFYESLKEDKWKKFNNLTTTWYVNFNSDVTEQEIITTTKSDMKKASNTAKISAYNAMVSVSSNMPTEFAN